MRIHLDVIRHEFLENGLRMTILLRKGQGQPDQDQTDASDSHAAVRDGL